MRTSGLLHALRFSRNLHTLRDMKGADRYIDETCLVQRKKVGSGTFGEVFLCSYVSGGKMVDVAVKTVNLQMRRKSDMDAFLEECNLLKKLQHSSIVDFIAITSPRASGPGGRQRCIGLVTEYCNKGSLRKLLDVQLAVHVEARGIKASMTQKMLPLTEYTHTQALSWLLSISKALKYLHSASPMIIHRDIKLDNILIHCTAGGKVLAKLADFGLSAITEIKLLSLGRSFSEIEDEMALQAADVGHAMTLKSRSMGGFQVYPGEGDTLQLSTRTGTIMYMAPEVFCGEKYNEKCDIFSFGVVMWELMTGITMERQLPEVSKQELWNHALRTSQGFRLHIPDELPSEVRALISDCWAQHPEGRPSARQVEERLAALKPVVAQWEGRWGSSLLSRLFCCSAPPPV